jgi:uncharacterized protein YdhG (YjbR/CyaY superfamily)
MPERRALKPKNIDDYLATLSRARRLPLDRLRRAIRRAVPHAEECISYGIPAFKVDGGIFAGFAATRDGYSFYPFSGQTLHELADDVAGYQGTRSALHVSVGHALPARLLRKLLDTRLAEIRRKGPARRRANAKAHQRGQGAG